MLSRFTQRMVTKNAIFTRTHQVAQTTQLVANMQNRLVSTAVSSEQTEDPLLKKISAKTAKGRALAMKVTQEQPLDTMERNQRYQTFIHKMQQLYRAEKKMNSKLNKSKQRMRLAHVQFQQPIVEVLSEYNKMTVNGFNDRIISTFLEEFNKVIEAQGNKPISYTDYTISEMDTSWRMTKVAEDIKFALTSDSAFFSPQNMARSARALGHIGYKHTEVQKMWLEHLQRRLKQDKSTRYASPPSFDHQVYGSMKNFDPRHYVFQGFQDSAEFKQHLDTLMLFKTEEVQPHGNEAGAQIEEQLNFLINSAKEVKTFQLEQQATFEALRRQFYALKEAQDKHEFLQENKYLMYDILELQELLVKGGYLNPEEALEGADESIDVQMQRASEVFHDIVLQHSPELLSPQIDQINQSVKVKDNSDKLVENHENHNDLQLGNLSQILVGLAEQALSFRRDALDNDYPTEFYEKLLMPEEIYDKDNERLSKVEQKERMEQTNYIRMERSYLTSWRNFSKHSKEIVDEHFDALIAQASNPNDLLAGLRALSDCKLEAKSKRDLITKKLLASLKENKKQVNAQAAIDGLMGIAGCWYQPKGSKEVVELVIQKLASHKHTTYQQKVEALNAMAKLASRYQQTIDKKIFRDMLKQVDSIVYEQLDSDLTYKQYMQLSEVHETLKHFDKGSFKNGMLRSGLDSKHIFASRYEETHSGIYDPLRNRVVQGLSNGMTDSELKLMNSHEQWDQFATDLRVKPDIMTGHKGEHIAVYVMPSREVMQDTLDADGHQRHMMSLSRTSVRPVPVAIDKIVDYDLHNYKLELKEDFSLEKLLNLKPASTKDMTQNMVKFCYNLTKNVDQEQISGNFDQFIDELVAFFQLKQRMDVLHEPEQLLVASDELKIALIKLKMSHGANLSKIEKQRVQSSLSGVQSFDDMIERMKEHLNHQSEKFQENCNASIDDKFNFKWQGARQSVELPVTASTKTKNICPELLSEKFLNLGEYHHYDDWKQLMQESYDQFNLLELKPTLEVNINRDHADRYRSVPKGIFPLADRKREVMVAQGQIQNKPSLASEFAKFEKDPQQYMVEKELDLSKGLKDVTPALSLITSLQNVKYSLLADYTEERIFKDFLVKLDVTDQLINEHLNQKGKQAGNPELLPRDPAAFRKHMARLPIQQSAFSQFYLKEAMKQERTKQIWDEIAEKKKVHDLEAIPQLERELEEILQKQEKENEDVINLSQALKSHIKVNIDVQSLGVLDQRTSVKQNSSISDEAFLAHERCLAESRLIKTKIAYKLYEDLPLTKAENKYLDAWRTEMSQDATVAQDCLVPSKATSLSVVDMSQNDFNTLNSVPRVSLSMKDHGKFALSDLLLEVSQVFDQQSVRDIELSCLQQTMKNDWQLSGEFNMVKRRNREIDQVMERYEELSFRSSGEFTNEERKSIQDIFNIGRGNDYYDRYFNETDNNSLQHFLDDVQPFDNRIEMLELWLCRKEQELKQRVNLATPELQQSDRQIHTKLEEKYRPARERLVAEIANVDQNKQKKQFSDLSDDDLHKMVEAICPRLNLFNREYPVFLPHAIKGLMEHPKLRRSDRSTLDAYTKMFNLDWRGDSDIGNKDEFMCTHPIYLNDEDQTSTKQMATELDLTTTLQNACQPFLPRLTEKILKR